MSVKQLGWPNQMFISEAGWVMSRMSNMANDNVELLRLGHRIQTERKMRGISQNGFAKDCGLNRSFFGGIERGERDLTFAVLCKICNGLHCDIANVTWGIPRLSYAQRSAMVLNADNQPIAFYGSSHQH